MKAIWAKLQHVLAVSCALCAAIALNSPAHAQSGPTRYVDADATGANDGTSWADAYTDLQDALEAMDPDGDPPIDTIWVAEGTYTPSEDIGGEELFQLIDKVNTYGGFDGTETALADRSPETNITILSADLNGDDPDATSSCCWPHAGTGCDDGSCETVVCGADPYCCDVAWDTLCAALAGDECGCNLNDNPHRFIWAEEVNATTVLSGFTIMRGSVAATPPELLEGSNGGAMVVVSASPRVTRCVFTENNADDGGAVYIVESGGPSQPVFVNCSFLGNASFNHGGGVAIMAQIEDSEATFVNCVFSGNPASADGGGIHARLEHATSFATLINCTFSGNRLHQTGGDGGGFVRFSGSAGSATLTNCILWGDSPEEISGSVTVTYSDIEGGWLGIGNIDLDPLFVDPGNGDFTVKSCSPVVDAADNDALPMDFGDVDDDGNINETLPRDLDLNDRVIDNPANPNTGNPPDDDPYVDMGAYEHVPDPCPWDLNGDCCVDEDDLAILIDAVGTDPGGPPDFDCNGDINRFDALELILHYGPCDVTCPITPLGCGVGASAAALGGALAQIGFADVDDYAAWVPPASEGEAFVCACMLQALLEAQP